MAAAPRRSRNNRLLLGLGIVAVLAVLSVLTILMGTGAQAIQGAANPTVAAADQATTARVEAKTQQGDNRAQASAASGADTPAQPTP